MLKSCSSNLIGLYIFVTCLLSTTKKSLVFHPRRTSWGAVAGHKTIYYLACLEKSEELCIGTTQSPAHLLLDACT